MLPNTERIIDGRCYLLISGTCPRLPPSVLRSCASTTSSEIARFEPHTGGICSCSPLSVSSVRALSNVSRSRSGMSSSSAALYCVNLGGHWSRFIGKRDVESAEILDLSSLVSARVEYDDDRGEWPGLADLLLAGVPGWGGLGNGVLSLENQIPSTRTPVSRALTPNGMSSTCARFPSSTVRHASAATYFFVIRLLYTRTPQEYITTRAWVYQPGASVT